MKPGTNEPGVLTGAGHCEHVTISGLTLHICDFRWLRHGDVLISVRNNRQMMVKPN